MSTTHDALRRIEADEISERIQEAGVSGAGGAGFPSYVKWERIEDADYLLVNHQESEPNCYVDKWIGHEHADRLADLFDALLDETLEAVVIGAKHVDRDPWLRPLEDATDATIHRPADLPLDVESATGVHITYTDDRYEYGMENVLLQITADTVLGKDLPIDYGWLVQNTETIYNIHRALVENRPVTHKFVHVDGYRADGRRLSHRLLEVPIGTPATTLLEAAGVPPEGLADDRILADGGPGWCFEVQRPPSRFGVRKRTNCLLVLDETVADEYQYGDGRIDAREAFDWKLPDPATTPTRTVFPDRVNVPIVTNDSFGGLVAPSEPTVELGDRVARGEALAEPVNEGRSVYHHAPIHGEVVDVTPHEIDLLHTGR